ncbi:MAG: hypothetical protein VYD19_07130, partial [Myxococcota bacterium]|nr:hypothetical protein [Myxococcota bacterium]
QVCEKSPDRSREGLCDIAGNVREWVLDEARGAHYRDLSPDGTPLCADPKCTNAAAKRRQRSAGWDDKGNLLRLRYRHLLQSNKQRYDTGFRVAWPIAGRSFPWTPWEAIPPRAGGAMTARMPTPPAARAATSGKLQRFGAWFFRADSKGVFIEYPEANDTRVFLPKNSRDGHFFLANRAGQFKVTSSSRSSNKSLPVAAIGKPASALDLLAQLPDGTRTVGKWKIERRGDDLLVRHPRNDFYLRFYARSNGWWDLRFSDGRDEKTIYSAGRI